ncbi:uncharacterized protein [Nicotiana tomentosiformis]|uniref:uncharacterized protein n=1 Tax=Nicotiana tomentosiformis TaxID=4098 RepID=UPI00388CD60A
MTRLVHRGALTSHGSYSNRPGQSSLSALPAQSSSRAPSVQGSSVQGSSRSYSGSRGTIQSPPPMTDRSCYECGEFGHVRNYCPRFMGHLVHKKGPLMTSALVTSSPAQPVRGGVQAARGYPRGGGRSGGGQARCCAFLARPKVVTSYAMITCIVSVCHMDASILFDPGSTYRGRARISYLWVRDSNHFKLLGSKV